MTEEERLKPLGLGSLIEERLHELASEVTRNRPDLNQFTADFIEAVEPLARLLVQTEPATQGTGYQQFAVMQLGARALNDLIVSFHLLTHGYLNQSYNAMRAAYEACDLMDLLATDPAQAELWKEGDKPWADFAPGRVRRKLGKSKLDPFYSHLSAMAHPTAKAADLTGHMTRDPQTGKESLRISLGPYAPEGSPIVAHVASLLAVVTGLVSVSLRHLATFGFVTEADYFLEVTLCTTALTRLHMTAFELMAQSGQPEAREIATETESFFQDLLSHLPQGQPDT